MDAFLFFICIWAFSVTWSLHLLFPQTALFLKGVHKSACKHAKLLQSCPTLRDPMDSSPSGSSVHGILQARILEWVAISFSNCKTQNSGLCSKEEKPRDPINQPSRCNTQEGLLMVAQTSDSDLLGGKGHRTANWASFLYAKKPYYQHITYGLQSDWLHVCKAIPLVQTSRAFV